MVIIIFIFVGIPLILDYRAENVEKSIRENNKLILNKNKGELNMKNGTIIYAKTHA